MPIIIQIGLQHECSTTSFGMWNWIQLNKIVAAENQT